MKRKCGMYKDDGNKLLQCNMCEVYEQLKCSEVDKIDTEVYKGFDVLFDFSKNNSLMAANQIQYNLV